MTSFKRLTIGLAAALLLAGVTNGARGQVAGGGLSGFGGESRGLTIIRAHVVCASCTLNEVHKAQPTLHHLYQLTHPQGQVVLQVSTINGATMWETPLSPRFTVRAQDRVFAQLTAEENLTKEMEITALLPNTATLDIATIAITG